MHKILISQPLIGSYSAFLFLGLLGGYFLARWKAPEAGIKSSHIDNLALLIAIFSLFGARFFSWIFYFPPGISLGAALRDSSGGMVFYGGMIFGLLTVVVYARLAKLPIRNLVDVFAPGLALGLALGRTGCFLAGCCWGDACGGPEITQRITAAEAWQLHSVPILSHAGFPLAVRFPRDTGAFEQHVELGLIDNAATRSLPVHPVQLYEAVLACGLCVWLTRLLKKRAYQGQVFCELVMGYAVIRFFTEFFRADNRPLYYTLTLSQVISIILAIFAIGLMVRWRTSVRRMLTPQLNGPDLAQPKPL
jgi:phosphatidylglycerol:prolipoprotein diacylglycerol transferase